MNSVKLDGFYGSCSSKLPQKVTDLIFREVHGDFEDPTLQTLSTVQDLSCREFLNDISPNNYGDFIGILLEWLSSVFNNRYLDKIPKNEVEGILKDVREYIGIHQDTPEGPLFEALYNGLRRAQKEKE